MGKSSKGGDFEREVCKILGLWWTKEDTEPRDDVFWRTATSGARATMRRKKGKETFGNYGDLQAVDPIGAPFLRVVTIELKRGYSHTSWWDACDRAKLAKQQPWEAFVEQAIEASVGAKTPYWLLIQRRDQKQAFVFMPRDLFRLLTAHGAFVEPVRPFVQVSLKLRRADTSETIPLRLCIMSLEHFLRGTKRKHWESLAGGL